MKVWLPKADAAALIGVSVDTIERRATPWQDDPVKFKIRFKYLQLDADTREVPRFYRPDVEAFLHNPKPISVRARKLFAPAFASR